MPRLPEPWIDHLRQGPTLRVGACTPEGQPELAFGHTARVLDDGRVELLLLRQPGAEVLAAIGATGRVAVSAGLPSTSRVLHLKGDDAEVRPAGDDHAPVFEAYFEAWLRQIEAFGADRRQVRAALGDLSMDSFLCVRFTPLGAWDQTPGSGAGQAIDLLP